MGQTLSEPVTTKQSACCRDKNYLVGSSCMQGWRVKMEDCHVHILSLPDDPGTAFFAVYDGHGGNFFKIYLKFSRFLIFLLRKNFRRRMALIFEFLR